jgi:NADPH:quinone reductase-like Zn-dependent oxidoreductase
MDMEGYMRQIMITKKGGPAVLKVLETVEPALADNEISVQVKAAGVNFGDILIRKGLFPGAPRIPFVPGWEVSGIVKNIGKNVKTVSVGQPVIATMFSGGYSEIVHTPEMMVTSKPESLSFEEAAAIPVTYLGAYQMLVVMGSLKKGETILIHNAGGGIGLAAVDIAKNIGAIIYGTASSGKHSFLLERGLDHVIDYRRQDWLEVLKKLRNGKGVDLVIDSISANNMRKSYKALGNSGRLGMIGLSTVCREGWRGKIQLLKEAVSGLWFNSLELIQSNRAVFGVHSENLWKEDLETPRQWMMHILEGVKEGWVRPHVDKIFTFDQAAAAHTYIENRKNIGKVVLVP